MQSLVPRPSHHQRWRPARRRTHWILGAGLLAAVTQAPRAAADSLPAEVRLRPAPVFASIERAWMIGNADSVMAHVGDRKVYISLPDGGPAGGTYSRAQSYFIIKQMFDATRTEEFSFVSIDQRQGGADAAFGRAERTFRLRDSSRLQQDRIFVSLLQEGERWVIAEIKSAHRD
jgi:hypothetical protein